MSAFVNEGARICGASASAAARNGAGADAALAEVFRGLVRFKMRDDYEG